jgi:hypothetical protein
VLCVGISTASPPGSADAPLAIATDNPAAPNNGTAQARLFRLEARFFCMWSSSHTFGQIFDQSNIV